MSLRGVHSRKGVVILGANLREDGPVRFAQQFDKEHSGRGQCLPDAFGFPVLLQFNEEEIFAQLGFGDGGGITIEMLVNEPQLAVVRVARSIGVVTQGQQISKLSHGRVGMFVIDGIGIVASRGANAGWSDGLRSVLAHLRARGNLRAATRLMVEIASE